MISTSVGHSWYVVPRLIVLFIIAFTAGSMAGCGGSSGGSVSHLSGNTSVTLLTSSTANDQLSEFFLTLNNMTLTNSTGEQITLFTTPHSAEFIHVNGMAEPITTVSIPQGTYTSAAVSVGASSFVCETLDPSNGNVSSSEYGYGQTPSANVSANLPSPIVVSGTAMGLSLDLLVSRSATWITCNENGIEPYSITPTFDIRPVTIATEPTNSVNGKVTGLRGIINSVNAGGTGLSVTAANIPAWEVNAVGPNWQVLMSPITMYQGITGSSQLAAGMPVDMDVTIQKSGSLLATRVAIYDPNTKDLSVSSGSLLSVAESQETLTASAADAQGYLPGSIGAAPFSFGDAVTQISGQFANTQSLPFSASFTTKNMVAGQKILISTHALTANPAPVYVPAATITLLPQTINGTVSAMSSSGDFMTYTVALATYDLFPTLAVQPGQTTLLANPSSIAVYVDSSAQLLNSSPIAIGSVLRFNGLVFNDNGALKMDCAWVADGVTD
jgi:hypothetical protein